MERPKAAALSTSLVDRASTSSHRVLTTLRPAITENLEQAPVGRTLIQEGPRPRVCILEGTTLWVCEVDPEAGAVSFARYGLKDAVVFCSSQDFDSRNDGVWWTNRWTFMVNSSQAEICGRIGPQGADEGESFAREVMRSCGHSLTS